MGDTPKLLFYAQEKGETPLELALHNLHIVYLWHSNVDKSSERFDRPG